MEHKCTNCGDRGIYMSGSVAVICKCMEKKALMNRLRFAQLTDPMRKYTFESFNLEYYPRHKLDNGRSYNEIARLTLQAAQRFVQEVAKSRNPDGLFITGPVGTGKTYLACCIANALLDKDIAVLFVVVPDFLDQIRSTYGTQNTEQSELEILGVAKSAPVIILDDLGAHHYTEWGRQKIYSLVNHRLNYNLPIVVTSNISLENLSEYLGERTTSRLFQMCRPCRLKTEVDIRITRRLGHEQTSK